MKNLSFILIILICSFSTFAESKRKNVKIELGTLNWHYDFAENYVDNLNYVSPDSILEKSQITFGIKSGMNRSRMNFNKGFPPNEYPFKQTWRTGLTLGTFMTIPISDKWSVFQEYNISRINGNYLPNEAIINLNYLSIPVFLRYSVNKKIHVISGFQFDLLISGKQIINNITETITKSIEERNAGVNLGIQYYISTNVLVEIRVMHGINSIGLYQREGIKEFKQEVLVISCGYLLFKNPKSR